MGRYYFLLMLCILAACNTPKQDKTLADLVSELPAIEGKTDYLESPFLAAGDRVYMVGHQDGGFPDLGWHIKGEMGGIWNHPIKLMDGLGMTVIIGDKEYDLHSADSFINFPMANQHRYSLEEGGLQLKRTQFVPDGKEGIVIEYEIQNSSDLNVDLDLKLTGIFDLRPTWLGERTEMIDSKDIASYDKETDSWIAKDENNPWYAMMGSNKKSSGNSERMLREGMLEAGGKLHYDVSLEAGSSETIRIVIAGSYTSEAAMRDTYSELMNNASDLFEAKAKRYEQLANQTKLTIPDKDLEQTFEWLKYNCDWLVRTVPEVGTGIGAGIPDYPWWFGVDSEYSLQGYMMIGQTDAVYNTIKLLDSVSEAVNGNGRIIHEMSTNGAVFNEGNINETPQFATLIWKIYQWNGDEQFLRKFFPTVKKGLNWLMTEKDADGNLFPDGFGMMEIHGLDSEMIDVAAYTQKAFADASLMAKELNETELAQEYSSMADKLKTAINEKFWSEEFGSYADFIGTDEQALHLIEDAIVRADTLNKPWAVEELKATKAKILANPSSVPRPFVLHHNWVVNTPMEVGIAYPDKAQIALETAKNYVNPFGVFVTGIDRDESAGSDDGSFKGSKIFSYTGAVMTLPTAVSAISENNYGNPDEALNYIKRMTRTFSYALPGSMYEVSPDYGMMTQAWNIYGFAVPIVEQFFGIKPDARHKTITIEPMLPSSWKNASLENVKIRDIEISIFVKESDNGQTFRIEQSDPSWDVILKLPKSANLDKGGSKSDGKLEIVEKTESVYYEIIHDGSYLEVSISN